MASFLAASVFSANAAALPPGTLDPTFGDAGVATYGFSSSPALITAEDFHSFFRDGQMLFLPHVDQGLGLAKLNTDGSPDTSFGNGGLVAIRDVKIWNDPYVQELPDGRIVAGAIVYNGRSEYLLARFNSNGTFDTTFQGTGRSILTHGGTRSHIALTDGRILLFNSDRPLEITRLSSDGSLDTSYGTGGRMILSFTTNYRLSWHAPTICLQPDRKVLFCFFANETARKLLRLNADGTVDLSFGTAGVLALPQLRVSLVREQPFLPLPSGELLCSGSGGISRFSATGILLSTIGGGILMGQTQDGKILHGSNDAAVYGLLDTRTWTSAQAPWPASYGKWGIVAPDPRGGFLISTFADYNAPRRFTKHLANGSLATSVGSQGVLSLQWSPPGDCSRIRLQETTSGELSMMFDQGLTQKAYESGRGDFIKRTGTRNLVRVSATGMPGVPRVLGDRSGLVVADLDRDGSCLLLERNSLSRVLGDGTRRSLPLPRLPSFDVAAITGTWDGGFLLGGHRPVYNYTRTSLSRYSASGVLRSTLHLRYYTGPALDFLQDGRGGWYVSNYRGVGGTSLGSSDWYDEVDCFRLSPMFRWDPVGSDIESSYRISESGETPIVICPGSGAPVPVHGMYWDHGVQAVRHSARIVLPSGTVELPEFEGEIAAAADSDGSIVVAGPILRGHAVRRITRGGTLDPAFGGEFESQDSGEDIISKVYRSKTGVWWVAGGTKDLSTYRLFISKLAPQPFAATLLEPDRPVQVNRRTGLMEHQVLVTNNSDHTQSLMLRVSDVPAIIRSLGLVRGTVLPETNGKKAWFMNVPDLPAGQSRQVTLAYHLLTRQPLVFTPILEVYPAKGPVE